MFFVNTSFFVFIHYKPYKSHEFGSHPTRIRVEGHRNEPTESNG